MKKQKKDYGIKAHLWVVTFYDLKKGERVIFRQTFKTKKSAHKAVVSIYRDRFVGPVYHKINFKI